ncbi:MAG: hypothetical protein RMJ51_01385 [Candidatus Calescibacterium sp.]|nr:hypothetical protein [Candidatus Calescibacterium sp.]MCX7972194.1 hypothetical protein [bacterium]MDW8194884.1 hypothetical protein [Candidatus Calescibacterium sp.]
MLKRAGLYFIILILIDTIVFREYLSNNYNLLGTADAPRQFLPYFLHLSKGIKEFCIPLWWEYNGLGYPFVGIIQSGSLYPLNYLFSILPQPLGYNLSVIFHLLLLQIAVYLYSNYLIRNAFFSFLASLSMSFSFFILIHLDIYPLIVASGYYVLVLYTFHKNLDHLANEQNFSMQNIRLSLAISLLLSLEFLAGYPQIFLYNLIHLGIYSITYIVSKKISVRFILATLALIILPMLITISVQLFATIELLENTIRKQYRDSLFNDFSYPPYMLLTYIFPYIFGNTPILEYWGPYHDTQNAIINGIFNYISIVTLPIFMFGIFIILKYKKSTFYPIVLSGFIGLILAFGYYTFIHYIMYFIPIYSDMRAHYRNIFQFNLCIAIVSSLGLFYLYKLVLIKDRTLYVFYRTVIRNLLFLILIFILFFLILESQNIPNILTSLYYNSSYLSYSLIFLCLYLLCFVIMKYNKKYLFLVSLILIADNQYFCSNLKSSRYINYPSLNIDLVYQNIKYVKKCSNIGEKNTLVFNRMANKESVFVKAPLAPTNLVAIHTNTRILNIYDPFIDMEYFYIFYMNDSGFYNLHNFWFFLYNPLILSTYGIDYIVFESDTNKNIFQKDIFGAQKIDKKDYKVQEVTSLKNLPDFLGLKITDIKSTKVINLLIIKIKKQKISIQEKVRKVFGNLTEFVEINLNHIYSIYYPYTQQEEEIMIIPYVIENPTSEHIIRISSIFRMANIESLKILSFPYGILSTHPKPFEIVYQRKNTHLTPIYQVWKNNQSFGKIYSTQKIETAKDFNEFREKLYSFEYDTFSTSIITQDQLEKVKIYKTIKDYNFIPNDPQNVHKLELVKANINNVRFFEKVDTVEFETNTDRPSFIVINNRYHPAWKCYLNQKEIPILKTNGIVQGIIVPPGNHNITLKFEPNYKKFIFLPLTCMFLQFIIIVLITSRINNQLNKFPK